MDYTVFDIIDARCNHELHAVCASFFSAPD